MRVVFVLAMCLAHLGFIRRVIFVLVVCLAHLGLVQSQPVTCSSNQPGISCTTSNSCRAQQPPVGTSTEDYIWSTCDPSYGGAFSMPALNNQSCEDYHCDFVFNEADSTLYEGPPNVRAKLETETLTRFGVHISWVHNSQTSRERRRGYQVQIFEGDQIFPLMCFCINDRNARSLSVVGPTLTFVDRSIKMRVVVAPYPLPVSPFSQERISGSYNFDWPRSCLDLGTHNCYPPTYPAPSNIQLHTSIYNTSEGVETRRLDIQWDAVMPNSSWNNTSDKLTHYVQLEREHREQSLYKYFKVFSVGNSTKVSVSLYPLNYSVNYTHIRVLTHYPCTGLATELTSGCGDFSLNYTIPPPGLQLSPTATTSVPSLYVTTTSLPSLYHTTGSHMSVSSSSTGVPIVPSSMEIAAAVISVSVLASLSMLVVLFVVGTFMVAVKPHRHRGQSPFRFVIPGENCPDSYALPFARPSSHRSVFVFYSPESKNEEFILSHIVHRLTLTGDIDVTSPCKTGRDVIPQWIEERVSKATAVFIVCDESFYNDWRRETCPYVNVLRMMFYSKISMSDPNKFAIVVLHDEDQFIPTDYLKTLKKFTIREDCDDDRELMIHFVRNTSPYELAPIESADFVLPVL